MVRGPSGCHRVSSPVTQNRGRRRRQLRLTSTRGGDSCLSGNLRQEYCKSPPNGPDRKCMDRRFIGCGSLGLFFGRKFVLTFSRSKVLSRVWSNLTVSMVPFSSCFSCLGTHSVLMWEGRREVVSFTSSSLSHRDPTKCLKRG